MYANYYHLRKAPFHITPDPEFLFLSPSHKEALGSIIYGVGHKKGFVLITGEVGVGKTTILRSYLEDVDRSNLKIIYIFNCNVSFQGLLKTIHQELGIIVPTDDVYEMVNQLHQALIEEYKKGMTVVLIIDEAQNMPVETLENIRMLSNLETSTDKLIQIVFSGQPEFEQILERKELRQLKQRIAVKATILPLTPEESRAYILHRLTKASAENSTLFTDGALRKIIKEAHGIPRLINIFCENAFITALGYRKGRITSSIAKEVISDFSGKKRGLVLKTFLSSLALVLAVLTSYFMYIQNKEQAVSEAHKRTVPLEIKNKAVAKPSIPATNMTQAQIPEESGITAAPVKALQVPAETGTPVIRVVKAGDTLAKLVEEVYGFSDKELIAFVKERNSGIYDADRILVGDQILFPSRKNGRGRSYE